MSDVSLTIYDITDKSLLSDENRMVGSSYVKGLYDLHNPIVSRRIEDGGIGLNELRCILERNVGNLSGLQNKRISAYATKLYKNACFCIARLKETCELIAILAAYVNEDTAITFVPICIVNQEYRSNQIGGHLIQMMEQYAICKEQRYIRVITSVDNIGARNFYERLGFIEIDKRLNEGREGIVYEKNLATRGSGPSGNSDR